ncbi:MAG: FAD-dependent oxidoreductase, partial [Planctomycetes bacterium]|nr:FAD-dependent oxidoreductase [Planctomycetota bacterium]
MEFEKGFDVLVCGAGVAGVAAALETARSGLKTALVEKTILTGGLATTGLVNIYLPLCDGNGTQVTFGIAEELLHLSLKYGPGDVPVEWRQGRNVEEPKRYRVAFSPASFVLALDEALVEAGVDLWLDTLACAPVMKGDRVVGVEVENKSGRGVLYGQCVIDGTGDADVAFRSGAECAEMDNWVSIWILEASLAKARKAVEQRNGVPLLGREALGAYNTGQHAPAKSRKWLGTRGREVTGFVLASRRILLDRYRELHAKGGDTDRRNLFPTTLPAMAQFRKTRRIVGNITLSDGQHGKRFEDSIGLVADWRKPGFVWEIPYGALIPKKVTGLLVVGRCISSEGDAWEVTRVIPPAAHTGQAAGIAA